MAVDLKLKRHAALKAAVGAKDRVSGSEGKISALEMANLKLSAQIEDLILETKREIYGTGAAGPKHSNQGPRISNAIPGKKPMVNSQLHMKNITQGTKNKSEMSHPHRKQENLEIPCQVTSVLTHENKVDRIRPATASVTVGADRKVAVKHPEVVRSSVKKNVSTTLGPTYQNTIKREEKKILQVRPSTQFSTKECQKFRHYPSDNVINTSQNKDKQTYSHSSHSPITRGIPSRRRRSINKPNLVSLVQCSTPMLDTAEETYRSSQEEMIRHSPKQLTPRGIKINQMTEKLNNQLSIDLTHLVGKKEPTKTISEGMQTQPVLRMSPCRKDASKCSPRIDGNPHLIGLGKESHQEGDFLRQPRVSPSANKGEDDDDQDEYLRQLLLNLSPRSPKRDSGSSRNSSASVSPKNDKTRPWYELLPIPDVELFDSASDFNNTCSTDSDSSGKVPVKVCPIPRQEYDAWTYLGDQTALMPRPVIRKSCKFVENEDSLSLIGLTDGETESIEDN